MRCLSLLSHTHITRIHDGDVDKIFASVKIVIAAELKVKGMTLSVLKDPSLA